MNIFEKLMLAKQMSFSDGEIELMGQRMVFYPSSLVALLTKDINDNPALKSQLYFSTKESMVSGGFGSNVGKLYGFTFRDYANWFVDLAQLAGWGRIRWVELDEEKAYGVIDVEESPVSQYMKGIARSPCDHVVRGFFAGGASSAFRKEVDSVEIECLAMGAEKCRFIIDSREGLEMKFAELVRQQLWVRR